jgi:hypothetical protein
LPHTCASSRLRIGARGAAIIGRRLAEALTESSCERRVASEAGVDSDDENACARVVQADSSALETQTSQVRARRLAEGAGEDALELPRRQTGKSAQRGGVDRLVRVGAEVLQYAAHPRAVRVDG